MALDIIQRVSKLNSIYGYSAKLVLDKNGNLNELIKEFYHEIIENKSVIENHFGKNLVEDICLFMEKNTDSKN